MAAATLTEHKKPAILSNPLLKQDTKRSTLLTKKTSVGLTNGSPGGGATTGQQIGGRLLTKSTLSLSGTVPLTSNHTSSSKRPVTSQTNDEFKSRKPDRQLTSDQLTSSRLTSDQLTSRRLTSDQLTSRRSTSDQLTSRRLTSDRLTSSRLTSDRLTSSRLTSDRLTSSQLTSDHLTSSRLTSDRLTSSRLTSDQLTTSHTTSSVLKEQEGLRSQATKPSVKQTPNSNLGPYRPLTSQLTSAGSKHAAVVSSLTVSSKLTVKSTPPKASSTNKGIVSRPLIKPSLATTMKLATVTASKPHLSSSSAVKPNILVTTAATSTQSVAKVSKQYITVIEDTDELPQYDFTRSSAVPLYGLQFSRQESQVEPKIGNTPNDIVKYKITLVQSVATSLLCSPDFFNKKDPTAKHLRRLGETLAHYDSEFLLKVALYTRCDLNIRSTANYLLALAASNPIYRPYLKKYFSAAVRIPSDWIEIAEIYQSFHDKSLNFGSLPTALRKVMSKKFAEFDAYQLAKYNKDTSKKKKPRKPQKGKKDDKQSAPAKPNDSSGTTAQSFAAVAKSAPPPAKTQQSTESHESDDDTDSSESTVKGGTESESEEELERLKFTLKQIIRKLHISQPVYHVMCLVGKKYPETPEEFRLSGLPDTWDQDRAGKRMKLLTPETWETQISLRGNKAPVWEELIDHRKLPFMAMLRNIRNLILAGVSMKHHQWVINRLTDERAVVNSKQFPFRFFSAYQVLNELERGMKIKPSPYPVQKGSRRVRPTKKIKEIPPVDPDIIRRYRNALDSSLMIATYHNVQPIKGTTIVLCNAGSNMAKPCTTARGLGKPRTVAEIGILLALMCKYACEKCRVCVYGEDKYSEVQLQEGTILHNMITVLSTVSTDGIDANPGAVPSQFLRSLLVDRIVVDNLIILTDEMNMESRDGKGMLNFLDKYRQLVNPNLLFVSVDLSSRSVGVAGTVTPSHENNVHLSGYSDKILQFIAERSDSGQLIYIERIDEAYQLKNIKTPSLLQTGPSPSGGTVVQRPLTSRWRTARVFISSTFRDMHGERDLLTRFVFPELRRRCQQLRVYVYEVDLRWGVTEEDTRHHKALEICMSEVSKSHYFIGLLGQRYGWCPEKYEVPESDEYDWIREYPLERSITELEMYHGALCDPDKATGKAFFYFRDLSVLDEIPSKYLSHFRDESREKEEKIEALKSRIRVSGLEVFDNYPSHWLGTVQNKTMLGSLEDFGKRVIDNLWNAIQRDYPEEDGSTDPLEMASEMNRDFMHNQAASFIGRRGILKEAMQAIESNKNNGLVVISGKAGSGKSAFVAAVAQQLSEKQSNTVIPYFIGSFPGSLTISSVLSSLCWEGKQRFSLRKNIPGDYLEMAKEWPSFLQNHETEEEHKVIVLIDAVDLLDDHDNGRSLDWLPQSLPDNVVMVISTNEGSSCHTILKKRDPSPIDVTVGSLDMADKAQIVRERLAKYRKHLDESPFNNQMKLLLTKREANNPLYLYLACEELRMFGVYEEVTTFLKKLPTTVAGLLQEILSRLEDEHGVELVSSALTILCLVRDGLKENELSQILALLFSTAAGKATVPSAVFARLVRSLQTFLQPFRSEESDTLILSHKDIEKSVKGRYLRGAQADRERQLHRVVAQFFHMSIDPSNDCTFSGSDLHSYAELPYHLVAAGDWKQLESIVCNLKFAIRKSQLGLAKELIEDYSPSTVGLVPAKVREVSRFMQLPKVTSYKEFISRNLHVLTVTPTLTLQQAVNEPKTSLVFNEARELASKSTQPLVYWINKPNTNASCKMIIPCQGDPALTVAISPNGHLLAAGYKSSIVRLYDIQTGKELKTFIGHASSVNCLCFVSQELLCSGSDDKTLSLWKVDEGYRVAIMKGHSRSVRFCAANKTGKTLVSVSWDMSIRVWNGTDGSFTGVLKSPGRNSPINCLSFHPEGQLVAVGCWDSTLKIWDTFNKKRLKTLKGHASSIQSCSYLKTGQHIVSASLDGDVRIWSAKTGITVGTISGHAGPINSLTFTPSGQYLLTASSDKLVKVWSGTLGSPMASLGASGEHGHGNCLTYNTSTLSVTVGYQDGFVCQYNIQTGMETFHHRIHSGPVKSICARNGVFMTASADQTLKIWAPASLPGIITLEGHTGPVTTATWTKHSLVSVGEDLAILVWPQDVAKHLSKKKIPTVEPLARLEGHTAQISQVAFSKDGMTMVSVSHDKSIIVWNMLSKKIIRTIANAHPDWINACCFTQSSPEYLLTGSNDFNIKVWNTNDWSLKTTLKGHTSAVTSLSYNGCIVSGSTDGSVMVWTRKGIEITKISAHRSRVNDIIVSSLTGNDDNDVWAEEPDDNDLSTTPGSIISRKLDDIIVLSAGDEGAVNVWKPFIPYQVTSLEGHSDRVLSVTCSHSDTMVTTSLDQTIRVWIPSLPATLETLSASNQVEGHVGSVTDVSLIKSPTDSNTTLAVTVGRDGYFLIWSMKGGEGVDQDVEDGLSLLYRVRASEKALSSVAMTKKLTVAIAHDTGEIDVWRFSETEFPTLEFKIPAKDMMGTAPVSRMQFTDDNRFLVASSWNNQVSTVFTAGRIKKATGKLEGHKDWVLDICTAGQVVYSVGVDQVLCEYPPLKAPAAGKGKKSVPAGPVTVTGEKYQIPVPNEEDERETPWPLRMSLVQDKYIAIVYSNGFILLWDRSSKRIVMTQRIHSDSVTCLQSYKGFIVTASSDASVKIWQVMTKGDISLRQVGLFNCNSSITAMAVQDSSNGSLILVGDCTGGVTYLRWK